MKEIKPSEHTQKEIVAGNAISPFDETMMAEAEAQRLQYKNKQLEGLDDESLQKFELFADGDSEIWKQGYIAGRSAPDEAKDKEIAVLRKINVNVIEERNKYREADEAKDGRIRELEEALRMLQKPENREHMISIASAALSGELSKELLNKNQ